MCFFSLWQLRLYGSLSHRDVAIQEPLGRLIRTLIFVMSIYSIGNPADVIVSRPQKLPDALGSKNAIEIWRDRRNGRGRRRRMLTIPWISIAAEPPLNNYQHTRKVFACLGHIGQQIRRFFSEWFPGVRPTILGVPG